MWETIRRVLKFDNKIKEAEILNLKPQKKKKKLIFQYKKLKSHNSLLQSLNSDKIEVCREVSEQGLKDRSFCCEEGP